jgi:hypothetical protein
MIEQPVIQNTGEKPVIYLDASLLKESSCSRRLLYTTFYGFTNRKRHQNYQAGYGSAIHRALETWYSNPPSARDKNLEITCIDQALKYYEPFGPYIGTKKTEFRTPTHLQKTLETYFTTYQPEFDEFKVIANLLESKWTLPIYAGDRFDIVLAGTIDLFVDYHGEECFSDHKTTSSYVEGFFEKYELDIQMKLYTWYVERVVGRRLPFVINGIFLKGWTKAAKEAKTPYFDGVNLQRSQKMTYTDGQMREFERWLFNEIEKVKVWLNDYYTINPEVQSSPSRQTQPNLSYCNATKWGCPYSSVCAIDLEHQDRVLLGMDTQKYNPLHFSD